MSGSGAAWIGRSIERVATLVTRGVSFGVFLTYLTAFAFSVASFFTKIGVVDVSWPRALSFLVVVVTSAVHFGVVIVCDCFVQEKREEAEKREKLGNAPKFKRANIRSVPRFVFSIADAVQGIACGLSIGVYFTDSRLYIALFISTFMTILVTALYTYKWYRILINEVQQADAESDVGGGGSGSGGGVSYGLATTAARPPPWTLVKAAVEPRPQLSHTLIAPTPMAPFQPLRLSHVR